METYLTFGGVPYYLSLIDGKQSPTHNIARMFFSSSAPLKDEFKVMLEALFGKATDFIKIITLLASHRYGLSRQKISEITKIPSGTRLTNILEQLEEAGFILSLTLYRNDSSNRNNNSENKRGHIYRLIDELSFFWNRFSKDIGLEDPQRYWLHQRQSQSYSVWQGYAFENACLNNIIGIKRALSFEEIFAWSGPARIKLSTKQHDIKQLSAKQSCEIDLLFDRADNTIVLIEIKSSERDSLIDKKLCEEIRNKCNLLSKFTNNKKTIQPVLLTKETLPKSDLLEKFQIGLISAEEVFA